jgi:hypothetical protein
MKKRMLIGANGSSAMGVSKAESAANIFSYASQGVGILANTLASISDKKKRREFEQSLKYLSADRQKQLERNLIDARSQNERLALLTDALAQMHIGRIYNISETEREKERRKRTTIILYASGVAIVVGFITYFILKKK